MSQSETSFFDFWQNPNFVLPFAATVMLNLSSLSDISNVCTVGRKFNKYGEISKPWWSSYTLDGFQNRSECLVDQYNKYPLDIEGKRIFVRMST